MISPVAGTVKYVNRDVADDPSVVNGDPYGEGWLLKVELDDDEPGAAFQIGILKAQGADQNVREGRAVSLTARCDPFAHDCLARAEDN